MSALHSALQALSPISISSVPTSPPETKEYLNDLFSKARLIIDSIPPPPADASLTGVRSRADTSASDTSGSSEVSASPVRSEPLDPANVAFQKEWGRPIKLSPKENPLGMAVFKAAGKDGKGAWFARRSVHEGMGFKQWKMGLQREFPESLEVQGPPGEGNVRGIGGERRVEKVAEDGIGMIEGTKHLSGPSNGWELLINYLVYHLSAQFPGPTTPRDFVTLLITSSSALGDNDSGHSFPLPSTARSKSFQYDPPPRHFMVISKPCIHPDCPPRDGFIRGQYESIEFIREIPVRPKKTSSTTQLHNNGRARANSSSPGRANPLSLTQNTSSQENEAGQQIENFQGDGIARTPLNHLASTRSRKRGRTISFAESRGIRAKGEAVDTIQDEFEDSSEMNPVEWVMVTRSDPGGSVPRFLVERGTPSGIVSDASKFIDWAFKKEHSDLNEETGDALDNPAVNLDHHVHTHELEAHQTNGHLTGVDETSDLPDDFPSRRESASITQSQDTNQHQPMGLFESVTNIAYSGIESYAPQVILDHLPGYRLAPPAMESASSMRNLDISGISLPNEDADEASPSSCSSSISFASAEERFEDALSHESIPSMHVPPNTMDMMEMTPHEKELKKLSDRKKTLDERLERLRNKELKDKAETTSREEERVRRAEEKHARGVQKQEQKYKKEVAKLEARRVKDAAREEERKKKAEEKDERARLVREKEELKQQLNVVCQERDILKEQVGALQRENTALVVKIGKLGDGQHLLKEIKTELTLSGESRSRSGSLRKQRLTGSSLASDATVPTK